VAVAPVEGLPFVSVIVPVYHGWADLRACLRALSEQTYPHDRFEVIVVDNGGGFSLEGSESAWLPIRVLEELQPGSYAARNRGVLDARGDIFAFTDSDCIPSATWIDRGVSEFLSHPGLDRVAGGIELVFHDRYKRSAVELYEQVFAFRQKEMVERWGAAITANMFVRREVFSAIGLFSTTAYSDGDREWGVRAHESGYSIAFVPEARVLHPSRRTWQGLIRKTRRIHGGQRAMRTWTSAARSRRFERLRQALTTPALSGIGRRGRVVAVLVVLKLVRTFEDVRLRLGGKPVRT